MLNLSGGELEITAQDDGLNATDKTYRYRYRHRGRTRRLRQTRRKISRRRQGKSHPKPASRSPGGVIRIDAEGRRRGLEREFFI